MNAKGLRCISRFAIVLSLLAVSAGAAASSCKSLEQQACVSDTACVWVDGYQRSDGRQVSAYCRAAPQKGKSNAALPQLRQTDQPG